MSVVLSIIPRDEPAADGGPRQVSWAYNWDSDYSGTLPSGVAYIPMLWSSAPELTSKWQANAEGAIANGAPYLLG